MPKTGILLLIATVIVVLGGRVAGPSDIWEKDQPRTTAYTIDMMQNGHWLLPRDMKGNYATKPPLYNWLSVPAVYLFGPTEWAFKLPSTIAGLGVILLVVWMGRHLLRNADALQCPDDKPLAPGVTVDSIALLAGIAWTANYTASQHLYRARPDMLMYAATACAWVFATLALNENCPHRNLKAIGFWICIAAAALTKGLPALLPIAYAILAAKLLHGKWKTVNRIGWWWGLPLAIVLIASWIIPTSMINPDYFKQVFVDQELQRVANEAGPWSVILGVYKTPGYFLSRFAPWSILTIIALVYIPPRQWFRHPLAPAILWTLLTILFFLFVSNNKARYVAPAYPAAAILASYGLLVGLRFQWLTPFRAMALGLLIALGIIIFWFTGSRAAKLEYGDNTIAFANQVKQTAKHEKIVFRIEHGENPIQALLGVNQSNMADEQQLKQAAWLITPVNNDSPYQCVILSGPVGPKGKHLPHELILGLYRITQQ